MASKLFGAQELVFALHAEDISLVSSLLEEGASPNLVLPAEGVSPFHLAVGSESCHALQLTLLFLQNNANPNVRSTEGLTPVHVAASWGRFQALELLLRSGGDPSLRDEDGHTALNMARGNSHWDCIHLLQAWMGDLANRGEGEEEEEEEDREQGRCQEERLQAWMGDHANQGEGETDEDGEGEGEDRDEGEEEEEVYKPLEDIQIAEESPYLLDESQGTYQPVCMSIRETTNVTGGSPSLDKHTHVSPYSAACSWSPCSATSSLLSSLCDDLETQSTQESECHDIPNGEDRDDSEITFPKRPSSSLLSTLRSSCDESSLNQALQSFNIDDYSLLSCASTTSARQRTSQRVSFAPVSPNQECVNNNRINKSLCKQEDGNHCSSQNLNDTLKSLSELSWSAGNDQASSPSSVHLIESGFGLDVTSPDHTILFSKTAARDRRRTMACPLRYPAVMYAEMDDGEVSSDEGSSQVVHDAFDPCQNLNQSQSNDGDDEDDIAANKEDDALICDGSVDQGPDDVPSSHTNSSPGLVAKALPSSFEDSLAESFHTAVSSQQSLHTDNDVKPIYTTVDSEQPVCTALPSEQPLCTDIDCKPINTTVDLEQPVCTALPSEQPLCTDIDSKPINTTVDSEQHVCTVSNSEQPLYTDIDSKPIDTTLHTDVHIKPIYRNRKSGASLVEHHLPPASGSEPSLLDFSVSSVDDTVIYDWNSFRTETSEEDAPQQIKIPAPLLLLTNEELKARLTDLGEHVGPVTSTTRSVYLNFLARLMQETGDSAKTKPPRKQDSKNINFHYELAEVLNGTKPFPHADDLEKQMVAAFQEPDPQRKWREGKLKSSFNYLLLDPRVTRDLPSRYPNLTQLETFRIFASAVFYVGKGKRSRPYAHFEEALDHAKKTMSKKPSRKVLHIQEVWSGGMGVVSLHCFQNVIPVEAFTREACMIDALGLSRLTNAKRGDYYGVGYGWSGHKKRLVGVHLLHKACQIFLMEGERQIRSVDICSGQ